MLRNLNDRTRLLLGVGCILLVGLVCRLLYLSLLRSTPAGTYLLIDSAFYASRARAIAAGLGWGPEPYFMNPLYPYLLAPLFKAGWSSPFAIGAAQSIAGILSVAMIGWLARAWFGARAAWWALVAGALYAPFWFYDGAVLTASPIVCLDALLLVALEKARSGRGRWLVVAGLAAGLCALLRPNILLFVVCAPFLLAWSASRPGEDGSDPRADRVSGWRGLQRASIVWLITCVVVAPATIRNRLVSGETVLVTTSLGMNFYTGNHAGATGIYSGAPFVTSYEPEFELADFQREAARRTGAPLGAAASSRYWLMEGVRTIRADPLRWLQLELSKLRLAVHHVESQNNLSIYFVRDWVPFLRWNPFGFRALIPLAALGAVVAWGAYRRLALPLGFVLSQGMTMLLFFVSSEYRLPMVIVLIPLAVVGVLAVADRLPRRMNARVWIGIGVALAVALVSNVDDALTRRLTSGRVDYLNFATLAEAHGDDALALDLLAESLERDPRFVPALQRQAGLAARLGRTELARASTQRLRAAQTVAAGAEPILLWDVDRAVALYRDGQYGRALDVFEKLLRGRPLDPRLLNNAGLCLYKLGELDEARRVLGASSVIDPAYLRARHNLALVEAAAGDTSAAIATLDTVLMREPRHWRSRVKRMDWWLAQGDVDRLRAELDSLRALRAPVEVLVRAMDGVRRFEDPATERERPIDDQS